MKLSRPLDGLRLQAHAAWDRLAIVRSRSMARKRKRQRRPDRHSVGPSTIAPLVPGESSMQRHARRMGVALESVPAFAEWAEREGWKIEIKNNGHHWILVYQDGCLAEWWPSSAKLVIEKRWNQGWHCHDVNQVRQVLETQRARTPQNKRIRNVGVRPQKP